MKLLNGHLFSYQCNFFCCGTAIKSNKLNYKLCACKGHTIRRFIQTHTHVFCRYFLFELDQTSLFFMYYSIQVLPYYIFFSILLSIFASLPLLIPPHLDSRVTLTFLTHPYVYQSKLQFKYNIYNSYEKNVCASRLVWLHITAQTVISATHTLSILPIIQKS